METNNLTPEQSLAIISDAICKSRREFEKNAGTPLIVWGSVVTLVSVAVWICLTVTKNPWWNMLWYATLIGFPIMLIFNKKDKQPKARSFVGSMIGYTWIAYGIFALGISLIGMFINPQGIGLSISLLLGFSAAITGFILKDYLIVTVGFITGLLGPLTLNHITGVDSTLILTACGIIDLLIPGIIMNIRTK